MDKRFVAAALALLAQPALSLRSPLQAQQAYDCAAVGGLLGMVLLQQGDSAGGLRLQQQGRVLVETEVRAQLGRGVSQQEAVTAMRTRMTATAMAYQATPARAVTDLASCRAAGMLPPGAPLTLPAVTGALGGAAPAAPATPAAPPPAAASDAEFRRFLLGPWGRTRQGEFDTAMILSSARPGQTPAFTRRACPEAGLASTGELLSHEVWFEARANGEFGLVRASGDPGAITTSWTPLTFKEQAGPDQFRYTFYNRNLQQTVTLALTRQGPDRLLHATELPMGTTTRRIEEAYGRCRTR